MIGACQGINPIEAKFLFILPDYVFEMAKQYSRSNIPIASVVIAFQPMPYGVSWFGMPPGQVALFRTYDPRERLFDCHLGACSVLWPNDLDKQIECMLVIKRRLVEECGISRGRIETAFRRCKEYREYRVELRRLRELRKQRNRRKGVGTA